MTTLLPAGQLDLISDEGWAVGWAWYPDAPERRAEVEILADGEVIGTATASQYRADVAEAGIGDGYYGFSLALPLPVLKSTRPLTITARDKVAGIPFPGGLTFCQPAVADVGEKLGELEHDMRLLTASIAGQRHQEVADTQATAALFQTVADFFSQLAEVTLAGQSPRRLRTLRDAVAQTTRDFAPLDFSPAAAPALSILLLADSDMPAMYKTLSALHPQFAGVAAELIILDVDDTDDAPLLPLVAANARYLRRLGGVNPIPYYNELAAAARGQVMLFLSGAAEPLGPWLGRLVEVFAKPSLGLLALQVLGEDGIVNHAGAMLEDGALRPRGPGGAEDFAAPALVDAPGAYAFAVRRERFTALGGLDERFRTLEMSLADFARRATAHGEEVLYDPEFAVLQKVAPAEAS